MNTGKTKIILIVNRNILLLILIALIIVAGLLSKSFFTINNITDLLRQVTIFGILALGLLFCIIAGNVDLSIGSLVSLIGCVAIKLVHYNYIAAIFAALTIGFAAGLFNGFIVGKLKANSVIATLGMMAVYQGMAYQISRGDMLFGVPESPYAFIGKGYLLKIPFPVYVFFILALFLYLLISRTSFGKYVFSTGHNEYISKTLGLNVGNIKIATFVIMGLCCAVSALVLSSRMTGSEAVSGSFYLFEALIAVILGGAALSGGQGSIGNTIIAILILGVLSNILLLLGLPNPVQQFSKGLIYIVAILINSYLKYRREL